MLSFAGNNSRFRQVLFIERFFVPIPLCSDRDISMHRRQALVLFVCRRPQQPTAHRCCCTPLRRRAIVVIRVVIRHFLHTAAESSFPGAACIFLQQSLRPFTPVERTRCKARKRFRSQPADRKMQNHRADLKLIYWRRRPPPSQITIR